MSLIEAIKQAEAQIDFDPDAKPDEVPYLVCDLCNYFVGPVDSKVSELIEEMDGKTCDRCAGSEFSWHKQPPTKNNHESATTDPATANP